MKEIIVGIGETGVLSGEGKVLQTGPLGAGVAVVVLDAPSRTAGLVHIALPASKSETDKIESYPGTFADTAIPALMEALAQTGLSRDPEEYTVKLVGGANVMDRSGAFDLGARNVEAVRRILAEHNLQIETEKTGGRFSRSVKVYVDSSLVELIFPSRDTEFI